MTGSRAGYAPIRSLEELQAKLRLQLANLRAQGRLRHVAAECSFAKVERVSNGHHVLELPKGERVWASRRHREIIVDVAPKGDEPS